MLASPILSPTRKIRKMYHNRICFALVSLLLTVSSAAQAQYKVEPKYMLGIDGRSDMTGAYTGLTNPNYGRLTFLYGHSYETTPEINHFHRIGAYAYTGPNLGAGTALTFTNNTLPEGGVNRLNLQPSNGLFVSGLDTTSEYEGLSITSFKSLEAEATSNPTSPEGYLYNSSILPSTSLNAGMPRYAALDSLLSGRSFALELVSRTTGLEIGTAAGVSTFTTAGARYTLGTVDDLITTPFLPVFWTADGQSAAVQNYQATFKLVDLDPVSPLPSSGEFTFQFAVAAAPEPISVSLLMLGASSMVLVRRRR